MKKLLLALSSFCLTATSNTTLIACGTAEKAKKFSKAEISDKIAKEVVAEISNDSKYGKMTGKQIFENASLTEYVVQLINKYTAEYFFVKEEKERAVHLEVEKSKFDEAKAKEKFNLWAQEIADEKLLQDYIKGINEFSYLEYQIVKKGYEVNFQTDDWQISGIVSNQVSQLTGSLYPDTKAEDIVAKGTKDTASKKNATNGFTKMIFEGNPKTLKWAKEALKARFKSYYKQEVLPEVYSKIITTTYLRNSQFLYNSAKKTIVLNKNSNFFSNMQTWDKETSIYPWKSNIKMVWELKVKDDDTSVVNTSQNVLANTDFSNAPQVSSALVDKIKKVFNDNASRNEVKDGVDPIWQIQGFKGFVAHDKNGGIYSKNTIDDSSVYKSMISKTNATGFLKNGTLDYFLDPEKGFKTYVFVLPIYAVDLMNRFNLSATDTDGTKKEKPISFSFKQGGNDDSIGRDLLNEWAVQGRINHSTLIEKEEKEIKEKLVQWVEYTIADQSELQTQAKTKYYSIIFNGNKDEIYSADLESAIGQFIK